MAIVTRDYNYADVYVSLLKYLKELALRISAKYDLPPISVMNLDSVVDVAKLPANDIIFISDWTLSVDGHSYGDYHELLIGFSVVNDLNFTRLETMYLNELMFDISKRKPFRTTIDIFKEDGTSVVGTLLFSDDYETMPITRNDSRSFKTVSVTLLSPQRLTEKGG
ncbi:MAG: hypothetical protein [Caudoviricetes sp.]|nr:MAG: hypothetical protein [Caudoviricetes sp.]